MRKNIVKKTLALLLVYAIIIVGIFYVQFKNDSIISERIGALRVTLSQTETDGGAIVLENSLRATFNGISIVIDDEHPASVLRDGENVRQNLTLVSWSKLDALSCEFVFTDDVALRFVVSDETENARLSMLADLPDGASDFQISYELPRGSEIAAQTGSRLQLAARNGQWELSAASVGDSRIVFTGRSDRASYAPFDTTRRFAFSNAESFVASDVSVYENSIASFKQNLISAFNAQAAVRGGADITEQDAVSFVAAMSENGRYRDALSAVPASFRQGTRRTYLSAPYFDSLSAMLPSLENQMTRFNEIVAQGSPDAFAEPRIADYLCMNPASSAVRALLENAANAETFTVRQAANVLSVYAELLEKNSTLAELVAPAVEKCVEIIEAACNADGEFVTVSENGVFLSVIDGAFVGGALLRYGGAAGFPALEAGGRLIVNSYISESGAFDLHTLSELYPLVVRDNPYYPHFALLGFDEGEAVWAWTCAANMTFARDAAGASVFTIDFPTGNAHYLVIGGVRAFSAIYIYGMAYRTDARFETYDSSGYVYRATSNTLLLKSQHRERLETVRLAYAPAAPETQESAESGASDQAADENATVENAADDETAPTAPAQAAQENPNNPLVF